MFSLLIAQNRFFLIQLIHLRIYGRIKTNQDTRQKIIYMEISIQHVEIKKTKKNTIESKTSNL